MDLRQLNLLRLSWQKTELIFWILHFYVLVRIILDAGRIDRKIEFPPPNEDARADILKIHSRRMNLMRGIDLKKIAGMMSGSSGAEVKGVCTEAGMFALRERRVHVT